MEEIEKSKRYLRELLRNYAGKIINNVTLVKYGIVKGIDTEICKRGVQVIETYKNKSIFIRILKRLKRNFKFINVDFIYNKSLKAIPTDYIIIFDSVDLASDVEYLRRIHPNKKILAWYRNPVKKSALPTLVKGADEIWSYSEEESKRYGLRYHLPFYIAEKPETSEESKTDVLFVGIDKGRYNSIMDCKKFWKIIIYLQIFILYRIMITSFAIRKNIQRRYHITKY